MEAKVHGNKKITTEILKERIIKKYGDLYDLSKVDYVRKTQKITIGCRVHGDFEILYSNFLKPRSRGCVKCFNEGRTRTQEDYIKLSIEKFGDIYTYDNLEYRGSFNPVTITCKIHGDFSLLAHTHLSGEKNTGGCQICAKQNMGNCTRLTIPEFVEKAKTIHGNKYDYSDITEYTRNSIPIPIRCKFHGIFMQSANNHLSGNGCPGCNNIEWYKGKFKKIPNLSLLYGRLYLIEIFDENECFLKIGVTVGTEKKRFSRLPYEFSSIARLDGDLATIVEVEQKLHLMFKDQRYAPNKKFGGRTECYKIETLDAIVEEFRNVIS